MNYLWQRRDVLKAALGTQAGTDGRALALPVQLSALILQYKGFPPREDRLTTPVSVPSGSRGLLWSLPLTPPQCLRRGIKTSGEQLCQAGSICVSYVWKWRLLQGHLVGWRESPSEAGGWAFLHSTSALPHYPLQCLPLLARAPWSFLKPIRVVPGFSSDCAPSPLMTLS